MENLFLEDLKGLTEQEVKEHISTRYKVAMEQLEGLGILIAYESVGSWGCDSSSFFLIKDKDGHLYENHASHGSCYGFEGQWDLEKTTLEYLKSDNFHFCTGGYDEDNKANMSVVKNFLRNL